MFKNWLIKIATELKSLDVKIPSARMCSVLIIICLMHKLCTANHLQGVITSIDISGLFSMLCLQPDITKSSCTDLQFLQSFIPDDIIKDAAKALVFFTNYILPYSLSRLDWIHVIPLVHFFLGEVKPFDSPKLSSKEIKWTDQHISLIRVQSSPAMCIAVSK